MATLMRCCGRRRRRVRAGIAPLEVVMALPIIMLLWAFIIWMGRLFTVYTEVTIEARRSAWGQRDQPSPTGDVFDLKAITAVEESMRRAVEFGIFRNMPAPESSHQVLIGSWDFRAVPLNHQLNWSLYQRVGSKMLAGKLDDLRSQVDISTLTGLTNANGAVSLLNASPEFADVMKQQSSLSSLLDGKLQSSKQDAQARIREHQVKVEQLEGRQTMLVQIKRMLMRESDELIAALERDKQEKKLSDEMRKAKQVRIDEINKKDLPRLEQDLVKVDVDISFYQRAAAQEAMIKK